MSTCINGPNGSNIYVIVSSKLIKIILGCIAKIHG